MRWMKQATITLLVAALAASCAAQYESPTANPSVGGTGSAYQLVTVDGQPLPATAYFGVDVSARATAGTLTLAADHTFSLHVDYVRHFASGNRDTPVTLAEQGTWSTAGGILTLTPAGGTPEKATMAGDLVTASITVPDSEPPARATRSYTFEKKPGG